MADNINPETGRAKIFPGIHPDARADTVATSEEMERATYRSRLRNGECPWCSDYDGDHPAQHASSAHPDEWADYKADEAEG